MNLQEEIIRDYYKKLLYLDKISRLNPISIYKTLKTSVPPIFNDNILPDMEISAKEQIEKIYSSYKKYKYVLSIDDFVALKYHFPNKMGRDQARIDKYCISFMPFAQSELIRTLLFPKRKTVDENVIRYLYKPLSKFPFVKNGKLYPFNKKMRYLIKLREKLFKKQRQEPSENTILLSREVKNYIFDEISSIKFKNNNILNKKLIETSINEFYKGDYSKKSILSSFLSFYIPERINKLL
ncbi:MAG: hypothetical protein GWP03_06635 [Proteobacteria bacterium]|nr:hypothetical protein [Pseudomonadota bacterium]